MKKISFFAIVALCFSLTSNAAFAAVGDQVIERSGNDYVVETVVGESRDSNGVLTQTVEKKTIPWYLYDPNNPRIPLTPPVPEPPKPVPPTPPEPSKKVLRLRDLGSSSIAELKSYAYDYRWGTTTTETFTSDSRIETEVTFALEDSVSVDNWTAVFTQKVTCKKGKKSVKFLKDGKEYSVSSIKRMLKKYGVRR